MNLQMLEAEVGLELREGLNFHVQRRAQLDGLPMPDPDLLEVELHLKLDAASAAVSGAWTLGSRALVHLELPSSWEHTLLAGPWYAEFDGLLTIEIAAWDEQDRPTLARFVDWVVVHDEAEGWKGEPCLLWGEVVWDPGGAWDVLTPETDEGREELARRAGAGQ